MRGLTSVWFIRFAGACALVVAAPFAFASSTHQNSDPLRYAFTTNTNLVMASGLETVGQIHGDFSEASWLTWTSDGNYVAALANDSPTKLIVIASSSGASQEVDCADCTSLAAFGGSRILALRARPATILVFDLGSAEPPVSYVPRADLNLSSLYVLDFIDGYGALAVGIHVGHEVGDRARAFFIDSHGAMRDIGFLENSDLAAWPAASTHKGTGNRPLFAVELRSANTFGTDLKSCSVASVATVDAVTGAIATPDASIYRNRRARDGTTWGIETYDFWWMDGFLYWRAATFDCRYASLPSDAPLRKTVVSTWRLEGTVWIDVDPSAVINDTRILASWERDGKLLRVTRSDDIGQGWSLYLDGGAGPVFVADEVNAVAML